MKKSAEEIIEGLSDKDIGDIDDGYLESAERIAEASRIVLSEEELANIGNNSGGYVDEYSMEADLYINKDTARVRLLSNCLSSTDNNSVTVFLIAIFVSSIGETSGAYFYDEKNKITDVGTYFNLLLARVPNESNMIRDDIVKKEYLKRLIDIKTYFDDARKLLVRNGWKEHTAFDKKSKDNFTKIIINRKYAS